MKIKIALLGLFVANSIIHPVYADQYDFQLEADEIDAPPMVEQPSLEVEKAVEQSETKAENLIKLGTTIAMSPAILYQDKTFSSKNSLAAQLKFKADLPKAWCNKNAACRIVSDWSGKDFAIKDVAVTIGKMVTMGYTSSIFAYEKTDSALLISGGATVLQIKYQDIFDCFRIGFAIERPMPLQVGLFDKNKSAEKGDKEEEEEEKCPSNKVDDSKNKKRPFKIKNSVPALGLNLGIVTDEFNIGLSGLGRCTDYTHSNTPSNDKNEENLQSIHYFTYGGNFGIQYQIVPKKFTATGQAVYVHGLGDYLSGLEAIQSDNERKEMCAAYYIDKDKDTLSAIDAWGLGGTLEYCATPKWTLSIRGSYLTTTEDAQKPAQAFRAQWNLIPKVDYAVNKYFTFFGGYNLVKELKIEEKEEKGAEHKFYGGIKFSL